eukprot:7516469-Lingulodinium_polyedra.AAC.1
MACRPSCCGPMCRMTSWMSAIVPRPSRRCATCWHSRSRSATTPKHQDYDGSTACRAGPWTTAALRSFP